MKIFKRRNLPEQIKYNNKTYVRNIDATHAYRNSQRTPIGKFVVVHVLTKRSEESTDLRGNKYQPTVWVFTLKQDVYLNEQ